MKDRIRQLMLDKGMSQKSFASELCIAEATLSGIFNGRTRPTNLTVNAIHECFPEVNISWLMFGEGNMYNSLQADKQVSSTPDKSTDEEDVPVDLFSSSSSTSVYPHDHAFGSETSLHPERIIGCQPLAEHALQVDVHKPQVQYIEKYIDKPQRKITEIRIFFDDGTYETFTP